MANASQAPDLEGLHHETHGIAEQIRIMNENKVCLIQHLMMNNLPPTVAPIQEEVNRSRYSFWSGNHESQSHHSTGRARSIRSRQRQSPSLLSKCERSPILERKPKGKGDHLVGMTKHTGTEISFPPRSSKT